MSKIPSDDAFARAKRRMKERDRNMDRVNDVFREYFKKICSDRAHDSHIMAEDNFMFRAYIFFNKIKDVQVCEESGVSSQLQQFVYEELERQGRGNRNSMVVSFEFDSDENVQASFEGDYYLRMR